LQSVLVLLFLWFEACWITSNRNSNSCLRLDLYLLLTVSHNYYRVQKEFYFSNAKEEEKKKMTSVYILHT